MENDRRAGMRNWSVEARDRQVHAVSPMHLQESRLINSLLNEAQNISKSNNKINTQSNGCEPDKGNPSELQKMLEKYQTTVLHKQQQQHQQNQQEQQQLQQRIGNSQNSHEIIRSFGSASPAVQIHNTQMSHSQPCLVTALSEKVGVPGASAPPSYPQASSSFDSSKVRETANFKTQLASTQRILGLLHEKNAALKQQCDYLNKKALRLQKLEAVCKTIENEYENLTAQKERQEELEKAHRAKMEAQLAKLYNENKMLHQRVEELGQWLRMDHPNEQVLRVINEMIPQNEELRKCKERQRMDIEALEVTLKDQRNHIQILEKALTNAQEKVWRKEKEVNELSGNVQKAFSLQKALDKMKGEMQAREAEWNRQRTQLEMENAQLKMQLTKECVLLGVKKGTIARSPDNDELLQLKKTLHASDARVTELKKKIAEMESKHLEELQRRATQIDALTTKVKELEEEITDKDEKVAELEKENELLNEKLENEKKNSKKRLTKLEKELERTRNSDERRFREDMAKMEEMRLKIADRRCFTADRLRCRINSHCRTSSGSFGVCQSHARTHSAAALIPGSVPISLASTSSSPPEGPLDLSSSSTSALKRDSDGLLSFDDVAINPSSVTDLSTRRMRHIRRPKCCVPIVQDNRLISSLYSLNLEETSMDESDKESVKDSGIVKDEEFQKSAEETWDV
ncbi:unnamed protein product [Enterobius vermicularis]|uniref:Angiomotin_C domain-containing protein n=1 Tax=Enterobius vermicularis TaxID=51028 RepID=A0A0N4USQ8_ENTVE|nr:unnamed protein product [Enterobius vermicularis]